ncbi:hypothetical protein BIW11_04298 [Tropilaelaps mercedesae]|uniref:Uncharacterized protein n=1 Tax=Tropilaelaps mercedesae TaxID=418985 RepID=A0A1V9X880_9ACAR|nr:hypothetical protein BIW11_04298 [Tropilaelaps mercedesae]
MSFAFIAPLDGGGQECSGQQQAALGPAQHPSATRGHVEVRVCYLRRCLNMMTLAITVRIVTMSVLGEKNLNIVNNENKPRFLDANNGKLRDNFVENGPIVANKSSHGTVFARGFEPQLSSEPP